MRQRTVLLGAACSLILTGIGVGSGELGRAAGTSIDASPSTAGGGGEIAITGSGFDDDCDVVLHWGDPDGIVLGTASLDDGDFATSITVPTDARPGTNRITAIGRADGLDGCGEPSGTEADTKVRVDSTNAPGRQISLIARTIRNPRVDQAVINRARNSANPIHAIVQLETLPEPGDLDRLESLGITPLQYLNERSAPGTAYLAAVSSDVDSSRFSGFVRAVEALHPQDKIGDALAASEVGGAPIDSVVTFFDDVSAAGANAVFERLGIVASGGDLGTYTATLSRSQIQRLATEDAVQFVDEAPEPGQLDLDNARALANVDDVQQFDVASATYLGLSGLGVQLSIHDSGVDEHHMDFNGRMLRLLHPGDGGDHGTHVASIAAGSGVMSDQLDDDGVPNGGTPYQWRGVAPQAGIAAYGSQTADNSGTMGDAINNFGVDVSNHSYSYNDGQYNGDMANIDQIIRGDAAGVPARPVVFSAGNQGGAPQYGENSGYYSLSKSCKNCIIVANLQDNGVLSGGSSHGPTPDGRLKPDVGANGSGVIAAGADVDNDSSANNDETGNSYRSKGGTSMATPVVTGVVALMLQQYAETFGVDLDTAPPLPSTSKAILVQTAVDQIGTASGTNPDTGAATAYGAGPDWGTGYGSVDALAATQMVADQMFLEDSVSESNATDVHYAQVVDGQDELRVTLAWDDLPGTPNSDHSTPQLVNDLDILLVGPNGEIVRPLVAPATTQFDCNGLTDGIQTGSCGGTGPGADPGPWPTNTTDLVATQGTDRLNNVEQAVVADPAPGLWQVRISVLNTDSTLRLPLGGTQSYSLAGVTDNRADLRIAKYDDHDPAIAGTEVIYTVVVTNDGPDTAVNVVVTDDLPDEVQYLSDNGGCEYDIALHRLRCELGDIAPGANVSFQVKTMVDDDTIVNESDGTLNIENIVTVSSNTPDLDVTDNVDTEITFVQDSADLEITKLCKPDDQLPAGANGECTIFVDNLGPSAARDVSLTDEHVSDGSFTITNVAESQGSCSVSGGDTVECDLGNLGVGQRATVVIDISADEDVDVNNVADVTAATPDPDTSNNQATAHLGIYAVADLSIVKFGPASATAGTSITYDISITNHGPSTAPGVAVTDEVPAGVTITSVTASGGASCTAGEPGDPADPTVCSFGTLASGASRTMAIEVFVLPDTLGIIHNDVEVSSAVSDDDNSNNVDTVATTVTGEADLSITKTDSPDPVTAGEMLTYTIGVTNDGPSTAFDVSVTDLVPEGTTFVSGQDGNGQTVCALLQPGTVVCDVGTMDPGATATLYVTVAVDPSLDPGTVLSNTAEVSSSTLDPNVANNAVTETTDVVTEADVWLDKQATLRSGNPSNLVTYTLIVHNDSGCETDAQSSVTPNCGDGGPSDARDIVVLDELPLNHKKFVVQYLSPQCAYDQSTHSVTCTAPVVPAGESVAFVIEAQISGSVSTINNHAEVSTSTPDPDVANNANDATIVHQGGTGGPGGGGGGGGGNGGGNGKGKNK